MPCEVVEFHATQDRPEQSGQRRIRDPNGAVQALAIEFGGRQLGELFVGRKEGGALFTTEDGVELPPLGAPAENRPEELIGKQTSCAISAATVSTAAVRFAMPEADVIHPREPEPEAKVGRKAVPRRPEGECAP